MKMGVLCLVFLLLAIPMPGYGAGAIFGPVDLFDDWAVGTWTAVTGLHSRGTNLATGVYTNSAVTNTYYYRIVGTNYQGYLPASLSVSNIFSYNTNATVATNAVRIGWTRKEGVVGYSLERSLDNSVWTNRVSLGVAVTSHWDTGALSWGTNSITNVLSAIPAVSVPWATPTDTTNLQAQITSNDTDIAGALARIGTNETTLTAHAARIGSNESDVATLVLQVTSNDTDIAGALARIGTNETTLTGHAARIGTNETAITGHAARIGSNETAITGHAARIGSNETDVASLRSFTNKYTGNILTNNGNWAMDSGTTATVDVAAANYFDGRDNVRSGAYAAFAGGGVINTANADYAVCVGGTTNRASGAAAFLGGGKRNVASGAKSSVAGGTRNVASGVEASVGGGENNRAIGDNSTVAGGKDSTASNTYATVAGGDGNVVFSLYGAIGGGSGNTVASDASYSSIGGGQDNTVNTSALTSRIGGGHANEIGASATSAVVGGGHDNVASGDYSAIPGGQQNLVHGSADYGLAYGRLCIASGGTYTVAIGRKAQALHQGAWVLTDSQNAVQQSTTTDQLTLRFQGGVEVKGPLTENGTNIMVDLAGKQAADADLDEWAGASSNAYATGLEARWDADDSVVLTGAQDLARSSGTLPTARMHADATLDSEWDTLAEINAASTDTDAVLDTDIGATVQAYDADLTGWAGASSNDYATGLEARWDADDSVVLTGAQDLARSSGTLPTARMHADATLDSEWDTLAEINAASTDTDAVLDTDIGATVQAYDADLTGWAGASSNAYASGLQARWQADDPSTNHCAMTNAPNDFGTHVQTMATLALTDPTELAENGTFASDADWTTNAGTTVWIIKGGYATNTLGAFGDGEMNQNPTIIPGHQYELTYSLALDSAVATMVPKVGDVVYTSRSGPVDTSYTETITANTTGGLRFVSTAGGPGANYRIDNVSLVDVTETNITVAAWKRIAQPERCRMRLTADMTGVSGQTNIILNSTDHDTWGGADTTHGRYYPQQNGVFLVGGWVGWVGMADGKWAVGRLKHYDGVSTTTRPKPAICGWDQGTDDAAGVAIPMCTITVDNAPHEYFFLTAETEDDENVDGSGTTLRTYMDIVRVGDQ